MEGIEEIPEIRLNEPMETVNDFIVTSTKLAGFPHIVDTPNFGTVNVNYKVLFTASNISVPPSILNPKTCLEFKGILLNFLERNNCYQLFRGTIKSFVLFLKDMAFVKWLSCRLLAVEACDVIMCAVFNEKHAQLYKNSPNRHLVNRLNQVQSELFFGVFMFSTRDKDADVRKAAYMSLLNWAENYRPAIYENKNIVKKLFAECNLLFLLFDSANLRQIVFQCIEVLISEDESHAIQLRFLRNGKRFLIESLSSFSDAFAALAILTKAARFLDLPLCTEEWGTVGTVCYLVKRKIAVAAANLLCTANFVPSVKALSEIHSHCEKGHVSLLIDAFYDITKDKFTFDEWMLSILNETNDLEILMEMFFYWVEKATTGAVPKQRDGKSLSKAEIDSNIIIFTNVFARNQNMLYEKVKSCPASLLWFIKLVKFLGLGLTHEELVPLAVKLLDFDGASKKQVNEACVSIIALQSVYPHVTDLADFCESRYFMSATAFSRYLLSTSVEQNEEEYFTGMETPVLLLHFSYDGDQLMKLALKRLDEIDPFVMHLKMCHIITLLHNSLLYSMKEFCNEIKDELANPRKKRQSKEICLQKGKDLFLVAKKYIQKGYPENVRYSAFKLLEGLIKQFGPHVKYLKASDFHEFSGICPYEGIKLIIDYFLEAALEKECKEDECEDIDYHSVRAMKDVCCSIVKGVSLLFSYNYLSDGTTNKFDDFAHALSYINGSRKHLWLINRALSTFCSGFPFLVKQLAHNITAEIIRLFEDQGNDLRSNRGKTMFRLLIENENSQNQEVTGLAKEVEGFIKTYSKRNASSNILKVLQY